MIERVRPRPPVTPKGRPHAPVARVIVISPLRLLAEALALSLRGKGFQALAPAADGQSALTALVGGGPQVILLDLGSLGDGGIQIGRIIMKESPQVKVLALGDPGTSRMRLEAFRSFHGWLSQDPSLSRLVQSIHKVLNGEKVVEAIPPTEQTPSNEEENLALQMRYLTRRERQVLGLLAQGVRRTQIAARLGISPSTVRAHISHILEKLNVHSQLEAVAVTRALGWSEVGSSETSG